jgi:adenine-specific DNA-methyltransferase
LIFIGVHLNNRTKIRIRAGNTSRDRSTETAWAELNSTISRPLPKPAKGRICVKVINHFGDEVQKVFFV